MEKYMEDVLEKDKAIVAALAAGAVFAENVPYSLSTLFYLTEEDRLEILNDKPALRERFFALEVEAQIDSQPLRIVFKEPEWKWRPDLFD